jgi:NADH-quinone oxidoreductase subunit J
MELALFYTFAAITLAGALLTISPRNPMYCALGLIVSLLGVAGVFLTLGAEFLFAVQILLYVGGVMVLFLFVIMLVQLDRDAIAPQWHRQWPLALSVVAVLAVELIALWRAAVPGLPPAVPVPPVRSAGNTERIADQLFGSFVLPFEAASILLLVAIVGAVMMAQKREARSSNG